jgi:ubiquinone/menaquinone biosynthesis C-methylase UbiE
MPATGGFFPGIIDYDQMSGRYQSGRSLSRAAAETWTAVVASFLHDCPCPRILDLGSGTGRFSFVFAQLGATVIGVEPSTGMLGVATRQDKPKNLSYLAGSAESLPLAGATCDLAWLSHVWHHVRDHLACVKDLSRVVRRGGHVLVRGTFGDRLDGFPTLFEFWPATRAICAQLPTIHETAGVFEANGFTLVEHRRIQQETAASLDEFARRTRSRADSALTLMSDSEFDAGQLAIEAAARAVRESVPVIEVIELLAFRNSDTRSAG